MSTTDPVALPDRLAAAAAAILTLGEAVTSYYEAVDEQIGAARADWEGTAAAAFARFHVEFGESAAAARASIDRIHATLTLGAVAAG